MLIKFHRYFSIQGRSIKHLYERWKNFKLNSNTDDIEDFTGDFKQTVYHLNHDDKAVLYLI